MQDIILVANGDLRESANIQCWPEQANMESRLVAAIEKLGRKASRGHGVDRKTGHGFIATQKQGIEVFSKIDRYAPLIIAEAVWQYSQNVLAGLIAHRGPILTVANWSGTYPGLVGLLNLNGSLTKAGVEYASLWSEDFTDQWFLDKLDEWLKTGKIASHDTSHVTPFDNAHVPPHLVEQASHIAKDLIENRSIMGIFDEGCMGMYNAIIPDELLFPLGVFKERLSQSALYHAAINVSQDEARQAYQWLLDAGMTFHLGKDDAQELTEAQVIGQCQTYIAAVRMAEQFGCETIGIQYQQGLRDLLPASDLVEGLLNNEDRPPVRNAEGQIIRDGKAVVHFNEVDECAGLDALMINRLHRALGEPVETTLHDLRWGDADHGDTTGDYVWVFEISGAAPPAHHEGGYRGSDSVRQPPMFFAKGGGTLRGIARPGELIWSRIYVEDGRLKMDIGRGQAVSLSPEETERRWNLTNREWPMMHGVLYGVTRDQMMARHKANHIQVVYASDASAADDAMLAKASLAHQLGIEVHLCGTRANGSPLQ
ncbi:fucose isomerase [Ochrobactrum quorumnocens]|uniref:Fucose isomerase n=1 Tax=Ochrobactrum quorumnocens TaxID=271865 RepID=A0A5N1JY14_9HYPH|nr:fucose isomerase [[Ochrobactrum] quorumnocens]KAA9368906.1 fucose isomerase [[Ochrobactrum] quorumnocens]